MGLVFSLTQEGRAENPLILCPALPVKNCRDGTIGWETSPQIQKRR